MFLGKKKVLLCLTLTGCMFFNTGFESLAVSPRSEAQTITINHETEISPLAEVWEQIPQMASVAVNTQEWEGKALGNTDGHMDIYEAAADGSKAIGRMFSNTIVTVEEQGDVWSKVTSGKVTGYVKTESLVFGISAVERANATCANGTKEAQLYSDIDTEKLMAAIIFCEAGNQPYDGKVAVGAVIMNRVESGRYPNTIKEVIYQRGQFTPAMTGKLARVLASGRIPASCYEAARDALAGESPVGNALYFNTRRGNFKLGDHYFS